MRFRALLAALFLSSIALAQDAGQSLKEGQEALARGEIREAIERYETFADRGGLHPDVSYNRGVAYLARVRGGTDKPGDLGKAAAAFEETLLLRPGDRGAEIALEAVRAEVARRRARSGASPEVAVSPGALRAFSGLLSENTWAILAAFASLLLSFGLATRKSHGPMKLASGVTLGVGFFLVSLGGSMAAYCRHLRLDQSMGVVVVEDARVVDERAVPVPGKSIPEAARVEILEQKGGLLRVHWGATSGYVAAQNLRRLGIRSH